LNCTSREDTTLSDLFFLADGTKMYFVGTYGKAAWQYDLNTAWNLSTAEYSKKTSVSHDENTPTGLAFSSDGTKIYVVGATADTVYQYPLGAAWDVSGQVYLNDQPLANFGSANVQERRGTMDQTCMTGFEKNKLEYSQNSELLYDEPQTFTTPNDFFDDIEYMVCFPNGLIKYHKDGDTDALHQDLKVRVRPVGGEWSDESPARFSAETNKPLFYNFKLSDYMTVNKGTQYQLEFTATTNSSNRYINGIWLRSIREVVDVAFTYPGKALVGIKAVATSQLSGRIDVKVIRE
ncbi:unnamed protein product, partial [marine sediment metagenome]